MGLRFDYPADFEAIWQAHPVGVNPNHLEAVPNQVNILRGMADSIRNEYGADVLAVELEWLSKNTRDKNREKRGEWNGIAEKIRQSV